MAAVEEVLQALRLELQVLQAEVHNLKAKLNEKDEKKEEKAPEKIKAVEIGKKVPNLTMTDVDGGKLCLQDCGVTRKEAEAVATTPRRSGGEPITTGLPRHSGWSCCSTAAKKASMSAWRKRKFISGDSGHWAGAVRTAGYVWSFCITSIRC